MRASISVIAGGRAAVARRTAHKRAHTTSALVCVDIDVSAVVTISESATNATIVSISVSVSVQQPLAVEESRPSRLDQRSTGRHTITIAETIRVRGHRRLLVLDLNLNLVLLWRHRRGGHVLGSGQRRG